MDSASSRFDLNPASARRDGKCHRRPAIARILLTVAKAIGGDCVFRIAKEGET
jgi:hypothetical protein